MKTLDQLTTLTSTLKYHIDCLMIRVHGCQQYIQKLLKIIGESSMSMNLNMGSKYSSMDEIGSVEQPNSERYGHGRPGTKKSMPEVTNNGNGNIGLTNNTRASTTHQTYPNLSPLDPQSPQKPTCSTKNPPSLNNLLLFSATKHQKTKSLESGSLTLMKNAILVNIHEIEQLQANLNRIREENQEKFGKCQGAIQLMTRVVGMMQDKMDGFLRGKSTGRTGKSLKRDRKDLSRQRVKSPRYINNFLSV